MIHRPTENSILFDYVKENSTIPFVDNSWINDASDSCYNEQYDVSIYFPNALEVDKDNPQSFNTFAISFHNTIDVFKLQYEDRTFSTVEEVVSEINQLFPIINVTR